MAEMRWTPAMVEERGRGGGHSETSAIAARARFLFAVASHRAELR